MMQVVGLPARLPLMSQRPEFGRVFMVFIKSRLICSTCSAFSLGAHSPHMVLSAQIRDLSYFSHQNAVYLYNGRGPICMRCGSLVSILIAPIARLRSVETKPKPDETRICSSAHVAILPCLEIITRRDWGVYEIEI